MFQELLLHQLFALILSNHFRVCAKTVFFNLQSRQKVLRNRDIVQDFIGPSRPSRVSLKLTPSEALIHELTAASQVKPELIRRLDLGPEGLPAGFPPEKLNYPPAREDF